MDESTWSSAHVMGLPKFAQRNRQAHPAAGVAGVPPKNPVRGPALTDITNFGAAVCNPNLLAEARQAPPKPVLGLGAKHHVLGKQASALDCMIAPGAVCAISPEAIQAGPRPDDVLRNIDEGEETIPEMVYYYVNDIYENLRNREKEQCRYKDYKSANPNIPSIRCTVVEWLVDIHLMFRMTPEALYLNVYLIDKFLGKFRSNLSHIHVISVSALLLSSKYHDVVPVECDDLLRAMKDSFTREDVFAGEELLLSIVDYNLLVPHALLFLRRFSKASEFDYYEHTMCKYFIEVALSEYDMLQYVPSLVAASAVYLCRIVTAFETRWTQTLEYYTKYREEEVFNCSENLLVLVNANKEHKSFITNKYASKELYSVSTKVLPTTLRSA